MKAMDLLRERNEKKIRAARVEAMAQHERQRVAAGVREIDAPDDPLEELIQCRNAIERLQRERAELRAIVARQAEEILRLGKPKEPEPIIPATLETAAAEIAQIAGVSIDVVRARSRVRDVTGLRRLLVWLFKERGKMSYMGIQKVLNMRTHTTGIDAVRVVGLCLHRYPREMALAWAGMVRVIESQPTTGLYADAIRNAAILLGTTNLAAEGGEKLPVPRSLVVPSGSPDSASSPSSTPGASL